MKWRMRRADGVYRWMAASAEAMRDQDGHIAQWYGLCHDIDDQLQAEEALRKREQELLQLVDALPVHIWSWTPTGKRSEEHTSELQSLMRISYAVFCLKKKKTPNNLYICLNKIKNRRQLYTQ